MGERTNDVLDLASARGMSGNAVRFGAGSMQRPSTNSLARPERCHPIVTFTTPLFEPTVTRTIASQREGPVWWEHEESEPTDEHGARILPRGSSR